MINHVVIEGRITKDIELQTTQSGKKVVNFTLAQNKTKDNAIYIPLQAWTSNAEYLYRYAKKGTRLTVLGELNQRTYTDKDGHNRNVVEVIVRSLSISEGWKTQEVMQEEVQEESSDELPF